MSIYREYGAIRTAKNNDLIQEHDLDGSANPVTKLLQINEEVNLHFHFSFIKMNELNDFIVDTAYITQHGPILTNQISRAERSLEECIQPVVAAIQRLTIPDTIDVDFGAVSVSFFHLLFDTRQHVIVFIMHSYSHTQVLDVQQSFEESSLAVMRELLRARAQQHTHTQMQSSRANNNSSSSSSSSSQHVSNQEGNNSDRLRVLDKAAHRLCDDEDDDDDVQEVRLVEQTRANTDYNRPPGTRQGARLPDLDIYEDAEFNSQLDDPRGNPGLQNWRPATSFESPPQRPRKQASRRTKRNGEMDDFIAPDDDDEDVWKEDDGDEDASEPEKSASDSDYSGKSESRFRSPDKSKKRKLQSSNPSSSGNRQTRSSQKRRKLSPPAVDGRVEFSQYVDGEDTKDSSHTAEVVATESAKPGESDAHFAIRMQRAETLGNKRGANTVSSHAPVPEIYNATIFDTFSPGDYEYVDDDDSRRPPGMRVEDPKSKPSTFKQIIDTAGQTFSQLASSISMPSFLGAVRESSKENEQTQLQPKYFQNNARTDSQQVVDLSEE